MREVSPELKMHPGYETMTLTHLLGHTAGLPAYTDPQVDAFEDEVYEAVRLPGELRQESILLGVLKRAPLSTPGEVFAYSTRTSATASRARCSSSSPVRPSRRSFGASCSSFWA